MQVVHFVHNLFKTCYKPFHKIKSNQFSNLLSKTICSDDTNTYD